MKCIDKKRIKPERQREAMKLLDKALQYQQLDMIEGLGEIFALFTNVLCGTGEDAIPMK